MTKKQKLLKERLELEVQGRNSDAELSFERPDPLLIAKQYDEPYAILLCALFAYGNVKSIIQFLQRLNMNLLGADDQHIEASCAALYYRFQNSADVTALFKALKRLKEKQPLQDYFLKGYQKQQSVVEGVYAMMDAIYSAFDYQSRGYSFLVGKRTDKTKGASALKRWMMFLRWMVREDNLDLGLWQDVKRSDLIIPLDTHTFHVSRELGLLQRKQYDLQAAIELTSALKCFDANDPVKYDFALYRIGQERIAL